MTSVATGRRAEAAAADFLRAKGCNIVTQNWRTRLCEIDIIAERGGNIYFCEVKYRRTSRQGGGFAYITPQKIRRMCFAAESWVHANDWRGPYRLSAIEVSGPRFCVTGAVNDLQL